MLLNAELETEPEEKKRDVSHEKNASKKTMNFVSNMSYYQQNDISQNKYGEN